METENKIYGDFVNDDIGKQLSNPFSTGGGGGHFEAYVQASFVVLMATGGFAPCMVPWPITKIKLQGKFAGYDTDDLIVFVEKPNDGQIRKILGQIKHSISITESDKTFGEVILAAWNDFTNHEKFQKNRDVIALITGPLSKTDINDVRTILEWSRHSEDAREFFQKVGLGKFSSENKRKKLEAFQIHLKNANAGVSVSDAVTYEFLRHFHLLGFDLDIKAGVTLSLLQSLIGQYSRENVSSIWARVVEEVQSANKNAGTITIEDLPEDLLEIFKMKEYQVIPQELIVVPKALEERFVWSRHKYASDLVAINMVGSWNEKNDNDQNIIKNITGIEYGEWIKHIKEILPLSQSPVFLKKGVWGINDRKLLWNEFSERIFDDDLDNFRNCIISVLKERDPQFELPPEERYAASIYDKITKYSHNLRNGMVETMALIGTQPVILRNCSSGKREGMAILTVREIFTDADWVLWGSLNNFLPTIAEAAPDEFLEIVENALQQSPCPFEELFAQEGHGTMGANYITGLLWALETLAWEGKYLVRVSIILGKLDSLDPGGTWSNRPGNSLSTILLTWNPQTTATVKKRKAAVETLCKEYPYVGWHLLIKLLPNQQQISFGGHKPSWRNSVPDDWKKEVSREEYWELVSFYSELAVSIAKNDFMKLSEIVGYIDKLSKDAFDKLLKHLSSEEVTKIDEEKRLVLWTNLEKFTSKHRRFSGAKWALEEAIIAEIEEVAEKMAPHNPINLHQRLFSDSSVDIHNAGDYDDKLSWEEKRSKMKQIQQEAIQDILVSGGISSVVTFAESVNSPFMVGQALAEIGNKDIDESIFSEYIENNSLNTSQLIGGYVIGRQEHEGWKWVDSINTKSWSKQQLNQLLLHLPFTNETWHRVSEWCGECEEEFWNKVDAHAFQVNGEIGEAIDKLVEYGRPYTAIDCLNWEFYNKRPLDKVRSVKVLQAAISSTESMRNIQSYHILNIIKALQEDPDTDQNDLFQIEWAYLPLLDRDQGAVPTILENRLASDPEFFCEVIRLVYKSRNEGVSEELISKEEENIATNAWRLLHGWQIPPGMNSNGSYRVDALNKWLGHVKKICLKSGHLEVALTHVGHVLFYWPPDKNGLWIEGGVAKVLNGDDAEDMRKGFSSEVFNSRGFHCVDPTGKPELVLAKEYMEKAEEVENVGYCRFATTLRKLEESYKQDAERILADHKD